MKRAAEGGNVAAQNRVAKLYVQGIGTDPDQSLGAAWYILARRAGLIDPEMDDVMSGLTADETKQAIEEGQPPALTRRARSHGRRRVASLALAGDLWSWERRNRSDRRTIHFRKHHHGQDQRQRNPSRQRHRA